MLEIVT